MSSADVLNEIERLRNRCIGCGKCSAVCPSLKHGGIDPMEVMMGGEADMSMCICCGNCSKACRRTDPAKVMMDLIAVERDMHPSQTFRDTGYVAPVPADAPEPKWTGDDVYIMPGCIAKCKVPYVVYAASEAMSAMGFSASELPHNTCCLHPVQFRDMSEHERRTYRTGMRDSACGKEIVTLCAGCSEEFEGSGIEAGHIIRFLYRNIDRLPRFDRPMRIAIEPGCAAMPFEDEMRSVVEAMGCEIVNRTAGCCGKGTPVAGALMKERQDECSDAEWIVVGCPMCQVKYDSYEGGKPAMHIAELVAMASGSTGSLGFHRIDGDCRDIDPRFTAATIIQHPHRWNRAPLARAAPFHLKILIMISCSPTSCPITKEPIQVPTRSIRVLNG